MTQVMLHKNYLRKEEIDFCKKEISSPRDVLHSQKVYT